jgi:acetolactate synthase I/II/III large subunit
VEGAEIAIQYLARNEIQVCFGNPGTTEMNLVRALAHQDEVRYVPTLFEGVAVGAADGYHRVTGRLAASLLHNGIGLTNALAGLLNARRGGSASLVLVGDHPDALQPHRDVMSSGVNIADAALSCVSWASRIPSVERIEETLSEALAAATRAPGSPVVVAVPVDVAWSDRGGESREVVDTPQPVTVPSERVSAIAALLTEGRNVALMLGNDATRTEEALDAAGRIAASTGCRLLSRPSVLLRGAGRVAVEPFIYSPPPAKGQLESIDHLVLVGANPPVMPWAYPDHQTVLMTREDAEIHVLAAPEDDVPDALQRLADELGAGPAALQELALPELATGPAHPHAIAQSLGALLPDDAIFLNEAISNSHVFTESTSSSRRHTMLTNLGGAIGWASAAAIGCALAAPDRKVVAVQGDGAAMYTPQALWTIARERLNVLLVILANQTYMALEKDLHMRGIHDSDELMRMDDPAIDWVSVARGLGLEAETADSADEFNKLFESGLTAERARVLVVNLAG